MHDLLHTMFSLYDGVLYLIAVIFTTDPWEAARRLYLMIQYARLLKEVWGRFRHK
jgi:hypothetical protein